MKTTKHQANFLTLSLVFIKSIAYFSRKSSQLLSFTLHGEISAPRIREHPHRQWPMGVSGEAGQASIRSLGRTIQLGVVFVLQNQ